MESADAVSSVNSTGVDASPDSRFSHQSWAEMVVQVMNRRPGEHDGKVAKGGDTDGEAANEVNEPVKNTEAATFQRTVGAALGSP